MKKTLLFIAMLCGSPFAQAQQDKITTLEAQGKTLEVPPPTNNKDERVFTFVEQKPEFPGGENALMKYLANNIKYPEMARRTGTQGTVYIHFIIHTDGSVVGTKILRGIGGDCDEEALRVVNAMPRWHAGILNHVPVAVEYTLPIRFSLDSPKK